MVSSLLETLIRDEGMRLNPYRDSRGKLTIGVGRNLDDVGLRQDEVMILLNNDIIRSTADARRCIPFFDTLDQIRREALVSMTFNMGIGGVLKFKHMLDAMQNSRWEEAADAALNSVWATQVGARAARIAAQIKTGQRQ